jgi:hypothetical protein
LAEIKAALVKSAESSEPPESPQLPPKPGESSRVIATELPDGSSTA